MTASKLRFYALLKRANGALVAVGDIIYNDAVTTTPLVSTACLSECRVTVCTLCMLKALAVAWRSRRSHRENENAID